MSDNRKKRDASAIGGVIDDLTEDSEFELFVFGIPCSLNSTGVGGKVWETDSRWEPAVPCKVDERDFHVAVLSPSPEA